MLQIAVNLYHPNVPCWCFKDEHADLLRTLLPDCAVAVCGSQSEFEDALETAHVALVWKFRQEWFKKAPCLRVVATPAAGRDYFAVIPPPHVHVFYGQFHGELIAETVVGMLLGMARGILRSADLQRTEPWPRAELARDIRSLRGSHVAILGFGEIGRRVGRLLKPFGVRLTGVCRRRTDRETYMEEEDRVVSRRELTTVLPTTNHLVLCLPGTPETDGLIKEDALALLPPGATLCNIGRGNAVDEEALVSALHSGRLAGACLDVFQTEPLPMASTLRTCPNLWLMPHASAIAPQYLALFLRELAHRLAARDFPAPSRPS